MIARLMSAGLPARIEVSRAAAQGLSLEGRLAWRRLNRLAELLSDPAGEFSYRLLFGCDAQGRVELTGALAGEASVLCQRCLQPMPWRFELPLRLQLVHSEVEEAASRSECLVVQDGMLNPQALIEDELLLALPSAPRHAETAECGPALAQVMSRAEPETARRPFTELAKLIVKTERNR